MDYTNVPKALIYEYQHELEAFPISDSSSLEYFFYNELIKRPFIKNSIDAPYMVLEIFNNAYYVATLIKEQKHLELYFKKFLVIASNDYQDLEWANHILPATMALVTNLLHYYDHYETSEGIIKQINDNFRDWAHKGAPEGQDDYYELLIGEYDCPIHCFIWKYFNPRNIIEDINKEDISVQDIIFGIDYLIERAERLHKDYLDKKIEFLKVIMSKLESIKDDVSFEDATAFYEAYYKVQKALAALNIFPDSKEEKRDNESKSTIETKLQARIRELEAENKTLRETVSDYKEKVKGLSREQAALFVLSMANTYGFSFTNKKKQLAPVVNALFGWGASSAGKRLCEGFNAEDVEIVANIFEKLAPELVKTIRNKGELKKLFNGRPSEETPLETSEN